MCYITRTWVILIYVYTISAFCSSKSSIFHVFLMFSHKHVRLDELVFFASGQFHKL